MNIIALLGITMNAHDGGEITCYIALAIVNYNALKRINAYRQKVRRILGLPDEKEKEEFHITIIPPFHISYKTASEINLGLALSTIMSNSPFGSSHFGMKGLGMWEFEGDTILHFPVSIKETPRSSINFKKNVERLRPRLKEVGMEIRRPLPENYNPHITIASGFKKGNKAILSVVKESQERTPFYFQASVVEIFAKYKGFGYRKLTSNPNTT